MDGDKSLKLTAQEITRAFSDPIAAMRYPPVMSLERAAEMIDVPLDTMRDWRKRGLLGSCSRRVGKHVRIFRDRFVHLIFNDGLEVT